MPNNCTHPYYETKTIKISANNNGMPLNRETVDICTDCGRILSADGQDTRNPTITVGKGTVLSCSHPQEKLEETEVSIEILHDHTQLFTVTIEACMECRHPPEEKEIPLNQHHTEK